MFLNEGIERFKQYIPEFSDMELLILDEDEPILLPEPYQHLIALYAAARCFDQDERHYQATTHMNEFEVKLDELKTRIEIGEIKIDVSVNLENDYVVDNYFSSNKSLVDKDDGVEGVVF